VGAETANGLELVKDVGIDRATATQELLAAHSIRDLVAASGGLYDPPARFRNW
jgi:malonate decarboxylase alpha subunit